MTDEPIQPEVHTVMNALAHGIDSAINPTDNNFGFVLMVFPWNEKLGKSMNYTSNGNRNDVIASMKEFIASNKGRYDELTEKVHG